MPTLHVGTHVETLRVSSSYPKKALSFPRDRDGTQSVPTSVPTRSVGTRRFRGQGFFFPLFLFFPLLPEFFQGQVHGLAALGAAGYGLRKLHVLNAGFEVGEATG